MATVACHWLGPIIAKPGHSKQGIPVLNKETRLVKNLAEQQTAFIPNVQLCIGFVFSIGVVACVGLLLGALIAVAYLLNLTVTVIVELSQHIASTYVHADPTVQFLMVCVAGYILYRFFRSAFLQQK